MIRSPLTSTGLTPVGFEPPPPPDEEIGFWEPLKAAFGLDNDVTNFLRWSATQGESAHQDADPNAWMTETNFNDSRYEQMYLDRFVDVQSTAQARAVMGRIDQEEHYRELLSRSGDRGFIAQLAAGVLSPTSLIPIAGWYGAMAKAGRAARIALGAGAAAASGGAAVALQEGFLQSVQETRPTAESVFNIIGGVVLGGVFGAGAAALSRQATDDLARRIMSIPGNNADERNLFTQAVANALGISPEEAAGTIPTVGRPAGAGAQVSTADRGSGRLASSLGGAETLGFQDPLLRSQTSEFEGARNTARDLAESPLGLAENAEGIATTIGGSVETRVKMARAPLAAALRDMDEQFQLYYFGARTRFAPLRSEFNRLTGRSDRLTYTEFKERTFDAMYNGDVDEIPQVMLAAKSLRQKVIEPLAKEAADVGMPLGRMMGDKSYVPVVYNTARIREGRSEFIGILTDNFRARQSQLVEEIERLRSEKGSGPRIAALTKAIDVTEDEIRALAQDVTNFILHNSPDRVITPSALVDGPKGALQEHILEIPVKMIRNFVEKDVEVLARMYSRTVATDANLIKKFGSVDMREPIRKINEEADRLIDRAKAAVPSGTITDAEARIESARLDRKRRNAIRDIEAIRDRLRGTYKLPDNPEGLLYRAGNVIRNLNYLRLLGGMTLSAIPDIAKPMFAYGLGKTFKTAWAPFTGKMALYKLAGNEVKLAGTALDMVLDSRVMAIADVLDSYGRGSKFERGLAAASRRFGIVSLMSPWNATIKQFTGIIAQSKMLEAIGKLVAGKASRKEIAWLASAGIDRNYAQRIWNQVAGSKGTRGYDQSAYHGTPNPKPFDRFSTDYMGQGEGHQAFGWGLYFADEHGLGKYYRDTYSEWGTFVVNPDGTRLEITDPEVNRYINLALGSSHRPSAQGLANTARNDIEWRQNSLEMAKKSLADYDISAIKTAMESVKADQSIIDSVLRTAEAKRVEYQTTIDELTEDIRVRKAVVNLIDSTPGAKLESAPMGRIYKVDIPDHDTLAWWDGSMAEQPPAVRKALESIPEFQKAWESFTPKDYHVFEGEVPPPRFNDKITFEDIYRRMQDNLADFYNRVRGDEAASKLIAEAGVPGHRFYDGNSRHMEKETFKISTHDGGWTGTDSLFGRSVDKFIRPFIKRFPEGRTVAQVLEYLKPFEASGGIWANVAKDARFDLNSIEPDLVFKVEQNKPTYNYVIYDDSTIKIQSYEQSAPEPNRLPRFNFQTEFPGRAEVDDLMDAAIANPTAENLDALSNAARDAGRDPNISPSDAAKLKDLRKAVQRKQFDMSRSYDQSAEPGTPAFDKWFKGSKVVDAEGKPLVVYHKGTFDENIDAVPRVNSDGFHFGTKQAAADRGAGSALERMMDQTEFFQGEDGKWHWGWHNDSSEDTHPEGFDSEDAARVDAVQSHQQLIDSSDFAPGDDLPMTEAYLDIKNPMHTYDHGEEWADAIAEAKAKGHDGIIYRNSYEDAGSMSYMVWDPTKIKSVNNRGSFDPFNPNVLYQRAYHGSAVSFDSFDLEKADFTGQGWGVYFTHDRGMAHMYRELKAEDTGGGGSVYEVEIPDPEALGKWESPVSEQTAQVRAAMDSIESTRPSETFRQWYYRAAQKLGDDRAVSKALESAGVPGHSYPDPAAPEGSGLNNTVIYGDKHIKIINRDDVQGFGQNEAIGPRARITMSQNRTLIELFKTRDASSFLHETGHKWLDELATDATMDGAPQQLVDDFAKTLKWLKVDSIDQLRSMTPEGIAANEKWAQATERYVATGKAPTKYLQRVFDQFKAWLLKIYESIKSVGINPPNDIRGVMNRMLDGVDAKAPIPPDAAVFEDVSRQLQSVGVPKEEAEANAALWAARYSTRAARRGKGETAESLYRAEGLDIRAPGSSRPGVASGGQSGPFRVAASDRIEVPETGHGQRDGQVWWANTEKWGDKGAVEAFRAAIVREVDKHITTPGQDIPLWMSTPLGRIIGQFKSFGLASVQRTLLSGLQQRDMAALNGMLMMLALGALTYKIKSDLAGVETSKNPGKWITEAVSQSGLLGWLMDANNIAQRATGGKVGLSALTGEYSSRYAAGDTASTLFGPTFELIQNLGQVGYAASNPDKMTASDIHVARRLVPLQNLFYLRWLFDQAEQGAANAMGVNRGG